MTLTREQIEEISRVGLLRWSDENTLAPSVTLGALCNMALRTAEAEVERLQAQAGKTTKIQERGNVNQSERKP